MVYKIVVIVKVNDETGKGESVRGWGMAIFRQASQGRLTQKGDISVRPLSEG